jgi:transposase
MRRTGRRRTSSDAEAEQAGDQLGPARPGRSHASDRSRHVEDVEVLIKRLLSRLARSRLEPFVRLGKAIRKHRDGILAAIRLGINQGRTEALNNKVRLITRRAYGFHSANAALALVLLTCGPITLHLPHELHALGAG